MWRRNGLCDVIFIENNQFYKYSQAVWQWDSVHVCLFYFNVCVCMYVCCLCVLVFYFVNVLQLYLILFFISILFKNQPQITITDHSKWAHFPSLLSNSQKYIEMAMQWQERNNNKNNMMQITILKCNKTPVCHYDWIRWAKGEKEKNE